MSEKTQPYPRKSQMHPQNELFFTSFLISRRHSLPSLSLPRLGSVSPVKPLNFTTMGKKKEKEEEKVEKEELKEAVCCSGSLDQGEESSNCSTPTMMEPRARVRDESKEDFPFLIWCLCRLTAMKLTTPRFRSISKYVERVASTRYSHYYHCYETICNQL